MSARPVIENPLHRGRDILEIRRTPPGRYRSPVVGIVPLVLYSLGLTSLGWTFDRKMPFWIGSMGRKHGHGREQER